MKKKDSTKRKEAQKKNLVHDKYMSKFLQRNKIKEGEINIVCPNTCRQKATNKI